MYYHRISSWAKENQNSARLAIFVSHILLIIIGLSIGCYVKVEEYILPKSFEFFAIFVSMFGLLLYPFRFLYQKEEKLAYSRAKRQMDAALLIGGFLLSIFVGNHFEEYSINLPLPSAFASAAPAHSFTKASIPPLSNAPAPSLLLKIKELPMGVKILLLVGTLAVAALFVFLIFGAGCSISCSGFSMLSNVFMIGGLAFWLSGIIVGIHHIFGNKPPSPNGKLFRKITGIIGLAGLGTMAAILLYYLTLSSGMSVVVPIVALLMFLAAAYYVVSQFDIKAKSR
ncbi:MAG: hypothetical protein ACKVTZ_17905 [Bacteroidia bacterium]